MSKKKGRAFKGPDPKSLRGDACYFYRDLGAGSYGGDVNCLQQFLSRKGLLKEEPTGYYGDKTEKAVLSWQKGNGVRPANGILGLASRQLYARKQRLPVPGTDDLGSTSDKKVCIDVCSEFGGVQDCETRCVKSEKDKVHACRESCQIAFSAACDRAYPPSAPGGPENYKLCLKYLAQSCEETCAVYR
ncbi:PG_binding_1 domain-containing protein [Chloropicon roscoffensis]|uniref:PG_binding_1 domain-containing protein n=1 Tax=Chloropicon roscoffensis TaxID=1461544 RepID=A0A7S2T8Y7_9CHLO|mmetsp:Transcript_10217/g.31215  ORF Transcript_10217/g.31215 Transcript_10217/m.31215 type:complete len:188 (+) Transcript_10217:51-614(+)